MAYTLALTQFLFILYLHFPSKILIRDFLIRKAVVSNAGPATTKGNLRLFKSINTLFLALQFRTRESNGLILYNAGRERDFIAVELVNGHIHYVFDLGDGPVRVRDTSRSRLNDGKWHAVSIGRPAPKRHTLAVDDHVTAVNSQGSNENLDLDGILYIGE